MLTAAECHLTFNSSTLVVARTLGHGCAVSVCWVCTCVTIAMAGWLHGVCVSRRKQHRPGIAPNANTTHVPTAGSSAAPTKPNHTPSRHSRAKGKLLLQTVTPHAAGSRRTHVSRTQECARTHGGIRMGFVWVHVGSFLHRVASPFHSFVTTLGHARSSRLFCVSHWSTSKVSYKRVKGRSHTVEKRKASHPQKPHATSQPSRFSHTPTLSTDAAHNRHSYQERPIHTSHHDISTGTAKPAS